MGTGQNQEFSASAEQKQAQSAPREEVPESGDNTLRYVTASRQLLDSAIEPSGLDPIDPISERPFQSKEIRKLLNKRARHQIGVFNLADAELNASNIESSTHPCAQALRRARYNTKMIWNNVKRHGGSAPTIPNDEFLQFAMQPGARIVEVTAQYDSQPDRKTHPQDVLAYALINIEENRLTGIFNPHNLFFPDRYLTRLVMDKVVEEFGDRPIRTRVMTSPERFANKASMDLMLEYGFRPDGTQEIIPDAKVPAMNGVRDKEETFQLVSDWLVREPGHSTPQQIQHLHDLDASMRHTAQALAPGSIFTAADATLAFWTTGRDRNIPYYFAEQQAENFVYAVSLSPPDRVLYRQNLEYARGSVAGTLFDRGTLNGIFIFDDVLDEVQKCGGNITDFLKSQVKQLKTGGQLVIKGKVTPGLDREFLIRMARRDLDCRVSRYVPVHYYGEEFFELYMETSDSVAIREVDARRIDHPSYLTREFYRHRDTGEIRELVSRKNSDEVLDLIVYSEDGKILERIDSPRGIPNSMLHKNDSSGQPRDYHLDGVISSGHEIESIALIRNEDESYEECILRGLRERAGLTESDILFRSEPEEIVFTDPARYAETKRIVRVLVKPNNEVRKIEGNLSGFSHSGRVQSRLISDVLKSQNLTSPTLTVAAYELLEDLPHLEVPMWPTAQKILKDQSDTDILVPEEARKLFRTDRPFQGAKWVPLNYIPDQEYQFNEIWEETFAEYGRSGKLLPDETAPQTVVLQCATTAEHLHLTNNRIPVCLCYRKGDQYRFGFQLADDKPLAEKILHQNELADGYDFYVPIGVEPESYPALKKFLIDTVEKETGLKVLTVRRLGRELLDSAGLTPVRSFPVLIEVDAASAAESSVRFCDAIDVKQNARLIRSLITRATTYRALHALGLLKRP